MNSPFSPSFGQGGHPAFRTNLFIILVPDEWLPCQAQLQHSFLGELLNEATTGLRLFDGELTAEPWSSVKTDNFAVERIS